MDLQQDEWWSKAQSDENAIILDVRTEDECCEGIIPGAIMNDIHKGQGFIYRLDELDKNKNFYVYCHAGARSAQACHVMNQLGIKTAFNLLGGMSNWNGPVVEPKE